MVLSKSAIEMAPPFSLVSNYFIVASLALLLVMTAFPFIGIESPLLAFPVAGFLHAYLLGFILMVIIGALYQLVPVVLEAPFYTQKGSALLFYVYAIGVVLLSGGMFLEIPILMHAGGGAVYAALSLFAVLLLLSFAGVTRWGLVPLFLLLASVALLAGISFGMVLLVGMTGGAIEVDIVALLIKHAVLSLGGFVMLIVMGVSLVLLPMFSLSHGVSTLYSKIALVCMVGGFGAAMANAFMLMWCLLGAGVLLYVMQSAHILYKRMRKKKEVWFYNVSMALASLVGAVVLGAMSLFSSDETTLKAALFLFLVGFGFHFVSGHLYKILPFLIWYEFISPLVGKQKVPMLHEMIDEFYANAQLILGAIGSVVFVAGLLYHVNLLQMLGALLLMLATWALMVVLYRAYQFKKIGENNE
jgi:hypothetical protein